MQRVHDAGFMVWPGYVAYSAEELAQHANGIGSEATPHWLIGLLDWMLPLVREPAFVHDTWGSLCNDGSRTGFEAWNSAFRENIRRNVRYEYAWWHPRRYRGYAQSDIAYLAVSSSIGWEAWQAAYRANHDHGPEQMEVDSRP